MLTSLASGENASSVFFLKGLVGKNWEVNSRSKFDEMLIREAADENINFGFLFVCLFVCLFF